MLMADYQTAGRGQGTNRWHSAPQLNLLASIYFRPPLPASRQFVFNEYFSLAVKVSFLLCKRGDGEMAQRYLCG